MKGITGLVIAGTLAIAGGICNWIYIARQADNYRRIGFLKVAAERIRAGDRFKESDFDRVDFPAEFLGNIETVAVKWEDRATVFGEIATRDYVRNQLVMHEDMKTPPARPLNEMIGANERVMWIPVDPRSFNPAHVNPGDLVSFRFPPDFAPTPTDAPPPDPNNPNAGQPLEEIVGPFRILALGNRRGSIEVARAARQRFGSENVIAISVEIRGTGLEGPAQLISDRLTSNNFKGVQLLLHPASSIKK